MSGLLNAAAKAGSTFGLKAAGKDPIAVTDTAHADAITPDRMRDLPPSSTGC